MSYINTLAGYRMSDGWQEHLNRGSRGGIDYAVGMNTPIPAPCDGRLENRPMTNGYGNYIRFHHGDGFIDEYLHLNSFVAEGNYKQGQTIGFSGTTGQSTGPHIHWHLLNPSGQRVNPLDYVSGGSGGSSSGINASMAAAQQIFANLGLYSGPIDGIFGPKSWAATQTWLKKYGLYSGAIDGVPGPNTYRGFQLYGQKNGNYAPPGVIDGVLGPLSWAGFVQSLKEDTAPAPTPPAPKPPVPTPPAPKPPAPKPPAPKPPTNGLSPAQQKKLERLTSLKTQAESKLKEEKSKLSILVETQKNIEVNVATLTDVFNKAKAALDKATADLVKAKNDKTNTDKGVVALKNTVASLEKEIAKYTQEISKIK